MADSNDICESCWKPIPPGATVFFRKGMTLHPTCWSRLVHIRAIELDAQTRKNVARANKATTRARRLVEKSRRLRQREDARPQPKRPAPAFPSGATLPGRPEALTTPPPVGMPSPMRDRPPSPKSATILVIDDHEDSRDALGQILVSLGHRAVLAANGRDALNVLQTVRPDLVLSDLRMPGMDGFAFIDAFRSRPTRAEIPVIALTGYRAEIATVRRIRAAGFAGHLTKPIDYDAIVGVLDEFLAGRPIPTEPRTPHSPYGISTSAAERARSRTTNQPTRIIGR